MTHSNLARAVEASLTCDLIDAIQHDLLYRRGPSIPAELVVPGGPAFSWSRFASVGMCVGLCMHDTSRRS